MLIKIGTHHFCIHPIWVAIDSMFHAVELEVVEVPLDPLEEAVHSQAPKAEVVAERQAADRPKEEGLPSEVALL